METSAYDKDQKDAIYSKEMIQVHIFKSSKASFLVISYSDYARALTFENFYQRDIDALRSQLEGLAALTAADGDLARKINLPRLATARMTPSRAFADSSQRTGSIYVYV